MTNTHTLFMSYAKRKESYLYSILGKQTRVWGSADQFGDPGLRPVPRVVGMDEKHAYNPYMVPKRDDLC